MESNEFVRQFIDDLSLAAGLPAEELAAFIEAPQNPAWGDLAFPCFRLSKRLQKDPAAIAVELGQKIKDLGRYASVTPVKAYLNVALMRDQVVPPTLSVIHQAGAEYGLSRAGNGQTVVIDFSSPNIVKPFHMGHFRTTMIGHSLARLHEAQGYRVIRLNYLGDWGTQFGKLISAFKRWGDRRVIEQSPILRLNELYVRFNTELENDAAAQTEARQWFKKLEDEDPEARELWQWFKDVSLVEFARIYQRLDITFSEYSGESFYNKQVSGLVKDLLGRGIARESQGAVIVDLEPHGLGVCLLQKADGASIYAARDVCAALDRYNRYHFDRMLYVTDAGQSLHFKQVFKILELMGAGFHDRCGHVPYGLVNLREGKMSTRQGTFVYLDEVLNRARDLAAGIIREKNPDLAEAEVAAEKVGMGAVIFADLSSRTRKDILFDWDEALNFNGETGPYVQYTYARLASILRKYGQPVTADVDFSLLTDDASYALIKLLMAFPGKAQSAAAQSEPSFVGTYVLEVCAAVNQFYVHNRVLSDDEAATRARVLLVASAATVLKRCLWLLGMGTLEEM